MTNTLRRTLNLPQLIFYGIGTMVGAGIYSVIGAAAAEAGPYLWISFTLAGIAAFFTVLSYAELASTFPKAGAEYQFLKAAFPKRPELSFLAGFLIVVSAAATSATVSIAFAGYLNVFIDLPHWPVALALLSICTLLNIAGIRESTWAGIAMICIEVIGLLLVVGAGFWHSDNLFAPLSQLPGSSSDLSGIFAATVLIFFIYIGFEDIANLSEESNDPERNMPRALIAATIITFICYMLVALAATALVPPEQLGGSDSPLTEAVTTVSARLGQAVGISALFATASTALISLISISRMLYGMAKGGDMPKILSRVLTRRQSPWVAALVLFVAACALLPLGQIKTIASVSSFSVLTVFVGVQASMIALRFRDPTRKRPFRVPLSIGRLPVLPAIGIIISLALLTQFELIVYIIGFGALISGLAFFYIRRHFA